MRALFLAGCFVAASAAADLPINSGVLPRQMPDGSKLFTFSTQWPPKMPGVTTDEMRETVLIDMLAQSLARAQWCSNGWEITNRIDSVKGSLAIEGKCK